MSVRVGGRNYSNNGPNVGGFWIRFDDDDERMNNDGDAKRANVVVVVVSLFSSFQGESKTASSLAERGTTESFRQTNQLPKM